MSLILSLAANSVPVAEHPDWRRWLWSAVVLCAGLAFAIGALQARQAARIGTATRTLDDAAKRWADAVSAWAFPEARIRGLTSSDPINVTWASTSRRIAARRYEVFGDSPTKTWDSNPLTGTSHTIKEVFARLPHRRMVIVGTAGSGKSTLSLLLVCDLLESNTLGIEPMDPVPVLLNAAEWKEGLTLENFLTTTMQKEAKQLAQTATGSGHDESWARLLVRRRRVFPILDGLDELPLNVRAAALEAWAVYCSTPGPAVMTARVEEFVAAIDEFGQMLPRTAVVEVDPITVDAVINYLTQQEHRCEAWEPVIRAMRSDDQGAVAKALRTPLYAFLARSVYAKDNPAELCAPNTPDQIRKNLLSRFLPAAYDDETAQKPPPGLILRSYRPDKAVRWLTYLSYLSRVTGSRNVEPKKALAELLAAHPRRVVWTVASIATFSCMAVVAVLLRRLDVDPLRSIVSALVACAPIASRSVEPGFLRSWLPATRGYGWMTLATLVSVLLGFTPWLQALLCVAPLSLAPYWDLS